MDNSADPEEPTDLDLHSLQRQSVSGFSRTRVKISLVHHKKILKLFTSPHDLRVTVEGKDARLVLL